MEGTTSLTLEGERSALGPVRRDLIPLYNRWDNDMQLSALRGVDLRPKTADAANAAFEAMTTNANAVFFTVYEIVFEHKPARPLGISMLLHIDRHRTAEFAIFLGERDAWNSGIGTEATALTLDYAFHALGLENVMLRVVASNGRAIKAYERAGFKPFGRRRGSYRLGPTAHDDLYMECVASEFDSPVLRRLWEKTF